MIQTAALVEFLNTCSFMCTKRTSQGSKILHSSICKLTIDISGNMSNKAKRLLVLLLIILKEADPTTACDSSCSSRCYCFNQGLTSVPQDLPSTITSLHLSRNTISTLSRSDFSKYTRLNSLYLGSNQISMIHNGTFQDLTSLTNLYLSSNQLTNLTSGTFDGLGKLWSLYLEGNQLTTLPAGIFEGLGKLFTLKLNSNRLTNLTGGMFQGLGELQQLYLSYNRFSGLPAEMFVELRDLRTLYLGHNALSTDIFQQLSKDTDNLGRLSLQGTQLTNVTADMFEGLSSLYWLDLSQNLLTSLPADTFESLGGLYYLQLSRNQLSNLPVDIFAGLSRLEVLDLSFNQFTSLQAGIFAGFDSSLVELYLSGNQLVSLPADLFEGLERLWYLDLDQNELLSLPGSIFQGLASLEALWLASNQLTSLPGDIFRGLGNMWYLTLYWNPWQCDCRMAPFKQRMTRGPYRLADIECAGPAHLAGKDLREDVSLADLICEETTAPPQITPAAQCPPLEPPANGDLRPSGPSFPHDKVTFVCSEGYIMVGPASLTCQADGTWTGSPPTCNRCADQYNFPADKFDIFDNRCYWFSTKGHKLKYRKAGQFCEDHGGRLVTIKSAEEQQFINRYISTYTFSSEWYRNFWIGLDDRAEEGTLKWSDGTTLGSGDYSNWKSPPKGHKKRDCVAIHRHKWVLVNCKWKKFLFICEMGCPVGYQQHGGNCYKAYNDEKTFDEAAATCQGDGGSLAMPRDQAAMAMRITSLNR
ncbi:uncharacterized protein LOC144884634 [Branchiostoma floridae x Branchiostoma japonicum]